MDDLLLGIIGDRPMPRCSIPRGFGGLCRNAEGPQHDSCDSWRDRLFDVHRVVEQPAVSVAPHAPSHNLGHEHDVKVDCAIVHYDCGHPMIKASRLRAYGVSEAMTLLIKTAIRPKGPVVPLVAKCTVTTHGLPLFDRD